VAKAIVEVLKKPRFEVYVPRMMGPIIRFKDIVPIGARDFMGRLFEADKVLMEADMETRSTYEQRISGRAREERELPAEEQLDRVDVPDVEPARSPE
jgi:hypothetical protein